MRRRNRSVDAILKVLSQNFTTLLGPSYDDFSGRGSLSTKFNIKKVKIKLVIRHPNEENNPKIIVKKSINLPKRRSKLVSFLL